MSISNYINSLKNLLKLTTKYLFGFLIVALILVVIGNLLEYILYTLLINQGSFLKIIYKYLLPASTITFSVLVIVLTNPIYSLLCLVIVFINMVLLLLCIQVEFLAMLYLIIYLGAIAVLFLFVIMMFNFKELQQNTTEERFWYSFSLFSGIALKFYYLILEEITKCILTDDFFTKAIVFRLSDAEYLITFRYNDIFIFTHLFFSYYSLLFIICGMLLLTSMIGSIVLALSTVEPIILKK